MIFKIRKIKVYQWYGVVFLNSPVLLKMKVEQKKIECEWLEFIIKII